MECEKIASMVWVRAQLIFLESLALIAILEYRVAKPHHGTAEKSYVLVAGR